MGEKEFLEKYGKVKVYFTNLYNKRITYENKDLGIKCIGSVEYRDSMDYEEDVYNISFLEDFYFEINNT